MNTEIEDLHERLAAFMKDNKRLREALRKYGHHLTSTISKTRGKVSIIVDERCPKKSTPYMECTCGLDAALGTEEE